MRPNLGHKKRRLCDYREAPGGGTVLQSGKGRFSCAPWGCHPPCLQHFRRAAAVKARPVRRLVGSVGDCAKQSPSLDGRCSAEYPPRRGVTPSFPFSIYKPGFRAFLSMLSSGAVHIAPCPVGRCDILVNGTADALTHILDAAESLPNFYRGPAVIRICYP